MIKLKVLDQKFRIVINGLGEYGVESSLPDGDWELNDTFPSREKAEEYKRSREETMAHLRLKHTWRPV